jgi:UrcA family protein
MRNHVSLIAALILAASPALAGETKDLVTFRFNRSALQTDEGAEKVYRAMRAKAWSDCDPRNERTRGAIEACMEDLISQWVSAAGDQRLAAIHAAGS